MNRRQLRKQTNEMFSGMHRRKCAVASCKRTVPAVGEILCARHWELVPVEEKREMLAARNAVRNSRPGDREAQKERWIKAAKACADTVSFEIIEEEA